MNSLAFIQNISAPEVLILGLIIILLFGAKRLPDLFGSLGRSIGEFKKGVREDVEEPVPVKVEQPIPDSSKSA